MCLEHVLLLRDPTQVEIPELELSLSTGTLGGMITTVEGLVAKVGETLRGTQARILPHGPGMTCISTYTVNAGRCRTRWPAMPVMSLGSLVLRLRAACLLKLQDMVSESAAPSCSRPL